MTPLYLAVVPRRSGWDQLVLHTGVLQSNVKRTEWNVCLFCLHRHIRQQFLKQLFADAFYIRELAHIFVSTVCFAVFDDSVGEYFSDAVQANQLFLRRGVDVDFFFA